MVDARPGRPRISVVIPALNEATTIARAISAFLVDPALLDIEVIVADGRSTDRTREVVGDLAADDPRIRLIDNPARVTPDALNAAIHASRGDIIVRIDGHAEPAPDYLASCLAALDATSAWNVGGRMVKIGDTRAARASSAAASSPFGIGGGIRHHLLSVPADINSVWMGCWPRWVFERVGLFDPEMVRNQDEELNRRILEAGGTIRFDPSIWAGYHSRASWTGTFQQYFRYGIYRVRAVQKHPAIFPLPTSDPRRLGRGRCNQHDLCVRGARRRDHCARDPSRVAGVRDLLRPRGCQQVRIRSSRCLGCVCLHPRRVWARNLGGPDSLRAPMVHGSTRGGSDPAAPTVVTALAP